MDFTAVPDLDVVAGLGGRLPARFSACGCCIGAYLWCTIVSPDEHRDHHQEVRHDQSECDVPQYAWQPFQP